MIRQHGRIKRLLSDSDTGRFLKKGGGWTFKESDAAVFPDIQTLIENCRRKKLKHAQMLIRLGGDPAHDVCIPVDSDDTNITTPPTSAAPLPAPSSRPGNATRPPRHRRRGLKVS